MNLVDWLLIGAVVVFAVAVALLPMFVTSGATLNAIILTLYATLLGQAWNVLGGFGGQFSFGHALFFGTGAYVQVLAQVEGGTLRDNGTNSLTDVVEEVRFQQSTARSSIAPAVLSLVLVALALLMRLLNAASELRVPELALASLRGVTARRLWGLGLAEQQQIKVRGAHIGSR